MIDINKLIEKQRKLPFTNTPAITVESVKQLLREYTELLLQKVADTEYPFNFNGTGFINIEQTEDAKKKIISIINDINFD